ncbi:unnamed protein product, partial [Timema podura]|nr:unnamed protein product [Timema podura]
MMEYYTILMERLNNLIQRNTDRKRSSKAILELNMSSLGMSIEDATLYLDQFTRQLELDHQTTITQLESVNEINKTLYDSAIESRYTTMARKVHIR